MHLCLFGLPELIARGRAEEVVLHDQGLKLAKKHGMEKVLFTINDKNKISIHVCEKLGGELMDTIEGFNDAEGHHLLRRYWITL